MSYALIFSNQAKKDLKKPKRNKRSLEVFNKAIDLLVKDGHEAIPENNRPHKLSGNYAELWECHALPDS